MEEAYSSNLWIEFVFKLGIGYQTSRVENVNIFIYPCLNGSSATITITALTQTVESQTAGLSDAGNAAGTSGMASSGQIQLVLADGDIAALSQSLNQ